MKKVKRFGALALALMMALTALTSCGGGGSSSSGSGSGSGTQGTAMDLSKVTDPCLAVSGLSGDTVVARLGSDGEITAQQLLYWYSRYGSLDDALELAAFHLTLHLMGQQENLTPDPSIAQELEQEYAALLEEAGDETLVTHILWAQLLSKELLTYFNESGDLFSQLADLYYGENSGHYPTDAEVNAWMEENGIYRVKHILKSTVDENRQPLTDQTVIAQKKTDADDMLAQLREAEDPIALFDQLMNEHSEDPGLATNPEGYTTTKGKMVAPFEAASLALQVGEISDVVESELGYHIILRLPIDPADYRDDVISDLIDERATQFQESLGLEKTPEFDKLDPTALMTQLTALQTAVYQEMAAIDAQNSGGSSSGGAASTSGSQG